MEATAEEVASWHTISDVADWVGLDGDDSLATPRGSFLRVLGMAPTDHWRVAAFMTSAQFEEAIQQWLIA
eukprot:874309-Amphidinium_carterae.1